MVVVMGCSILYVARSDPHAEDGRDLKSNKFP